MELTNTYTSKDELIVNKGNEIVHAKISVSGTGPGTVYKIYVYIRNVGWSLMGTETVLATAKSALITLSDALAISEQNRSMKYPWSP